MFLTTFNIYINIFHEFYQSCKHVYILLPAPSVGGDDAVGLLTGSQRGIRFHIYGEGGGGLQVRESHA